MAGIRNYAYLTTLEQQENNDEQMEPIERFRYPQFDRSETQYKYVNSARDFTLPLQKHRNDQPMYVSPDEEFSIRTYLGVSVELISLITENLLSHPFIVLRRQCQVHHNSTKYHLTPFSLMPVIIHLQRRQGVPTLWKGLGSCLLIRGMSMAVEDLISKFTPWPKEINVKTSAKQFGQHILLKSISLAVVLPFYSASLVETVQSDIASEKPGIFDVFREGATRLVAWTPQKGRMIPIWALVGPTVALGLSKYMFSLIIKGITIRILTFHHCWNAKRSGARPRDTDAQYEQIEMLSKLVSLMTCEILFFPFETILHRLQLQGTRTIIDNLDNGNSVIPILTSYEGAIDCYRSTVATEGFIGLYKGFGAMILQFGVHFALIKLTKWIVGQISDIYSPPSSSSSTAAILKTTESRNSAESTSISKSTSPLSIE